MNRQGARAAAEAGFATPAAVLVSLAIATTTTAMIAASGAQARLARADLAKLQAESLLAGAHQRAVLETLSSGAAGRLLWDLNADGGSVSVLAEAEAPKVGLAAAAKQNDAAFRTLGVTDAARLRSALGRLDGLEAARRGLAVLDVAPKWRDCADSLASPFGLGERFALEPAARPRKLEPAAHVGEVWRIRVSQADGWTDDRLVRFTGDLLHPAAVLTRRFTRTAPGRGACDLEFKAG